MENFAATIRAAIGAVSLPSDRLLVIHSSLALLRPPTQAGKWAFLGALRGLLDQGLTLALPTFTFDFCRTGHYHHQDSRPETGLLGEWFLELDGVRRSRHPIYSFAVAGPLADRLHAAGNSTTFGPDSVLAACEELEARLVMMGAPWDRCTQLHRYEEEAAVPYRAFKTFAGTADWGDGPEAVAATMLVRRQDVGAVNDFTAVEQALRRAGAIARAPLFGGLVESVAVGQLAACCRELLAGDPFALTAEPKATAHRMAMADQRRHQPPVTIALLGHANLDLVRQALSNSLAACLPDRTIEVWTPPFGQVARMILDPGSDLHALSPDITFFVDRFEDVAGVPAADLADAPLAADRIDALADAVAAWRRMAGGAVVVARPVSVAAGGWGEHGGQALARALADRFEAALSQVQDLHWLDVQAQAAAYADGPVTDDRLWHVGRYPFSDGFSRILGQRLAGLVLAALGRTARLLVLDLDNTLWGGVLGEDGADGIRLGGDYPGNVFVSFQRVLKSLTARGVALAVSSKNDEDLALRTMREHPDMAIRPDDLVGWRIDWNSKPANVAALCAELNLGPASVLFIDDNPAERERMRAEQPAVQVLELPDDPARYVRTLLESPWLGCLSVTDEDRRRVGSYQRRREVEALRGGADGSESFYASLRPRVSLLRLGADTVARAAQLMMKTNQFNTTTRRHDRQSLEAIDALPDGEVLVIEAADRFSEPEKVGVLVLRSDSPEPGWLEVDSYLLSCRVLGRGIETGLLLWLLDQAAAHGRKGIAGRIVETERNAPARSVFAEAGFCESEPGLWRREVSSQLLCPAWFEVVPPERTLP